MPDRSFRRFPPASLVSDPRPADGVQGPLAGSGSAGNDWLRDEWQPHWGDPCRTKSGLPARYLGGGWALALLGNGSLSMMPALPPCGGEEEFPLPSLAECDEWAR